MKTTITASIDFIVQTADRETCAKFNRKYMTTLEILHQDGERVCFTESLEQAFLEIQEILDNCGFDGFELKVAA